jgi:hypothetical protein
MHHSLRADLDGFPEVLGEAVRLSDRYLDTLSQRHVSRPPLSFPLLDLPEDGMGSAATLRSFEGRYFDGLTASTGSRSFGYVVGGATPAAVAGDWLTSALDQDNGEGVTVHLETEAARMLGQLLGVPEDYFGTFVTGAAMANFTGLATGRQWHGRRHERVPRAGAEPGREVDRGRSGVHDADDLPRHFRNQGRAMQLAHRSR